MIQGIKVSHGYGIERGAWNKVVEPSNTTQYVSIPDGNHNGEGQVIVLPIPDSAMICRRLFTENLIRENDSWEYTSDVRDMGNNRRKGIFACATNMKSFIIQGSNDKLNWNDVVRGSTNGNNEGDWGTPSIIYASDVSYRYFRVKYAGYNNGWKNVVQWGVFTS